MHEHRTRPRSSLGRPPLTGRCTGYPRAVEHPAGIAPAARDAILAWYAERGRPLAFRRTSDPYAILVSEAMAQQTQAARAAAYWERFMARFPTVEALAAATPADVLRAWQGLGLRPARPRPVAGRRVDRRGARRPGPRLGRGARGAARRRPVHRAGGGGDRVRPARSGRSTSTSGASSAGWSPGAPGRAVGTRAPGRRRRRGPARPAGRLDARLMDVGATSAGRGGRGATRARRGLVPLRGELRRGAGPTPGRLADAVERRAVPGHDTAGFAGASSTGCGRARATWVALDARSAPTTRAVRDGAPAMAARRPARARATMTRPAACGPGWPLA